MTQQPDKPGVDDPGKGRRLALDVGTARIGVAVSDSMGMLATPVETVPRSTPLDADTDGPDIDRLAVLVAEYRPVEVIVGLPRNLKGHGSKSVDESVFIGSRLACRVADTVPAAQFRYADERLTTVLATRALQSSGVNAKKGRAVIDQAAAVEILQSWLDGRRTAGL